MSSPPADRISSKGYLTRAPSDRRRPATLEGFTLDDEHASTPSRLSAPSPVPTTSSVRPKPVRALSTSTTKDIDDFFDRSADSSRSRVATSDDDDSDTQGSQNTTASARPKDPVKPSIFNKPGLTKSRAQTSISASTGSSSSKKSDSSARASLQSLKLTALSAKTVATPRITTLFGTAISASSAHSTGKKQTPSTSMPPPKNIPPKPTTSVSRVSYPPASQRPSSRAENPQPGDDEDNPIVVDQANEDSTADISSSSHQRKDRAPEAALEAAIKRWRLSNEANVEREKAASANKLWIPPKGVSAVYIYFDEPFIGSDKDGKQVLRFPCRCCDPPVNVPRSVLDSGTNTLRSHVKARGISVDNFPDPKVDEMLKAQALKGSTQHVLTPGITRQMAVAWVTVSCRPLSVVEDEGFLAFLADDQVRMMPSHQTVSRDIAHVSKGMVQHIQDELANVQGCFHLATDIWTSANGYAFLGLIICYQRSGVAVRRVLEMIPFLEKHDARSLAEATYRVLTKYGVASRVWNIVSDNASENTSMMPLLAEKSGLPRFKTDDNNDMACRVRCAAHVLNLISKAILNGFSPKPTKKKTQGEEETADAGDADKENCEEEGDWEVEADEETASDDDDSEDGSNDPQGAIEDEDDLDVSRALNPDLDVYPGDEDQLRDVAKSAAENANPSTSSRATRELLLRNKEIAAAMKKMAWLATLLRYSPYKRRMFQRHCAKMGCEEPHTLLRDVVTRWDSTKDMIQRGLKLWQGILSFTEAANSPIPADKKLKRSDESDFRKLLELLTPIAKATKKFSDKQAPNIGDVIGMFEDLDKHFDQVSRADDIEEVWKQAAARGHFMSAKYYGLTDQANVIVLGTLLHPNYRKHALSLLKWPRDWQNAAVAQLRKVFVEYYQLDDESPQSESDSQNEAVDQLDSFSKQLMQLAQSQRESSNPGEAIDVWLKEPITPLSAKGERVDALQWWWAEREKGNERSGLTALALDVFSCPATSVDAERLFSRAGRVVTPLRHKLKAEKIGQIVTLGRWFLEKSVPEELLANMLEERAEARRARRAAKSAMLRKRKATTDNDAGLNKRTKPADQMQLGGNEENDDSAQNSNLNFDIDSDSMQE